VQVTDEHGNIATYRIGEDAASVGSGDNGALRRQAVTYSRAVEELHADMNMGENERLFMKMMELGGEL
jgi:hypothetical protein